jgi:hypothetical protein
MPTRRFPRPTELALAAATLLTACGSDSPVAPIIDPVTGSITVDASAASAYIAFGTPAQVVTVANPATSTAWDMALFATTVSTNGGAAGPGGVSVSCVCQNAQATTAQIQTMTAANQLAIFDAVTSADIPAASFQPDALDPVITGWYTGSGATASVRASRAWIMRKTVSGAVILGKFRVTGITGASATTPGQLTVEYAIEPSEGAPFGATQTATVMVTAGTRVYLDLSAGGPGSAASWDIAFDGWNILSNGGVSGSGTVKGVVDDTGGFATIDLAYATPVPPQAYRGDTFSGVFAQNPWYRYNITGTDNQIWPVFNVYLVRRGTTVFKVQLTSYYSPTGAPRNITVRYAQIAG